MNATLTNRKQLLNEKNRSHATRFDYNNKYRVIVTTTYNQNAKMFRTIISLMEFDDRQNGIQIEKSIGSIYDYWFSNCIETISVPRFSKSTFANAIESGLTKFLNSYQTEYEKEITQMLTTNTYTHKVR